MPQIIQRMDRRYRREATTLATATTQKVFASLNAPTLPTRRQAVSLHNCDATADLYVTFIAAGSNAPTISSTDHDILIPARGDRQFMIGLSFDVWIRSSSAGSINYTAVELD